LSSVKEAETKNGLNSAGCGKFRLHRLALSAALVACASLAAQAPTLEALERAVAADPESLRLAADYRQLAIAAGTFDRSVDFLQRLAGRKGSGPHIHISLALAYIDKVPTAGEIRRLYLGRSAMNTLTASIERQPSVLAYYMRGVINLYYNNFIFHRTPRGIEDLQKALSLVTPVTPPLLAARVWASLGDGYWRAEQMGKARETWTNGLARFPDARELVRRARGDDKAVERIVHDAVDPDTRVDTTLRDVVP
jgi:tetratricopeptide (TPR) repeat protein